MGSPFGLRRNVLRPLHPGSSKYSHTTPHHTSPQRTQLVVWSNSVFVFAVGGIGAKEERGTHQIWFPIQFFMGQGTHQRHYFRHAHVGCLCVPSGSFFLSLFPSPFLFSFFFLFSLSFFSFFLPVVPTGNCNWQHIRMVDGISYYRLPWYLHLRLVGCVLWGGLRSDNTDATATLGVLVIMHIMYVHLSCTNSR